MKENISSKYWIAFLLLFFTSCAKSDSTVGDSSNFTSLIWVVLGVIIGVILGSGSKSSISRRYVPVKSKSGKLAAFDTYTGRLFWYNKSQKQVLHVDLVEPEGYGMKKGRAEEYLPYDFD